KLAAFVADLCPEASRARVTARLAHVVGAPLDTDDAGKLDPVAAADQIRAAFEDLCAGACAKRPLLIAIEDLQWGDLTSVNLLDPALRRLRDRPLLVIAFARPEVFSVFPKLWAARSPTEIWVSELSKRAAGRLVREALGPRPEPEVDALVARAGGNPF